MSDTPTPAIYKNAPNLALLDKITSIEKPTMLDLTNVYSALFSTFFLPEPGAADQNNTPASIANPSDPNASPSNTPPAPVNPPAITPASKYYEVITSTPYVYDYDTKTYKRSMDEIVYKENKENNHYMVTDPSLGHFDVFNIKQTKDEPLTITFSLDHKGEKYVITYAANSTTDPFISYTQDKKDVRNKFLDKLLHKDNPSGWGMNGIILKEYWENVQKAIIIALKTHIDPTLP
jgi:hypothetical protein